MDDKSLPKFFSNPIFGFTSLMISIISIVLAIWFYFAAKSEPELTYYVHPLRSTIVKMGDVSRLSVSFDGKDITHDVTSVQIALWNRGKKSIRGESILKPIFIYTNDGTPLLEAKIVNITRDIIGVSLDTNHISRGKVGLSWRILENSDGFSLQLIYGGPLSTQFKVDGVIEGQKTIAKYEKDIGIKSEQEQYRSTLRRTLFDLIGGVAFIVVGVFFLFKIIRNVFDEFAKSTRKLMLLKSVPGFILGFLLVFIFGYAGITSLFRWFQKGPPFSF